MIVAPAPTDQSFLSIETEAGTPIVFVDRLPRGIDGDAVMVDNVAGAAAAVHHLVAHGHRRIAYLGDSEAIDTAEERRIGYEQALRSAGLQVDPSLVDMSAQESERVASAVQRMLALKPPVTAFFTGNAPLTRALLMRLNGISAEAGIVGFDDFDLAELLGITVVAQDPASIGRTAASLLMGRIQGEEGPFQHIRLRTALVRACVGDELEAGGNAGLLVGGSLQLSAQTPGKGFDWLQAALAEVLAVCRGIDYTALDALVQLLSTSRRVVTSWARHTNLE